MLGIETFEGNTLVGNDIIKGMTMERNGYGGREDKSNGEGEIID